MTRIALTLSLALLACSSPRAGDGRDDARSQDGRASETRAEPAVAALPWPKTFEEPAVLMAARVVITGPEGLREHAALLQDPDHHAYEEKTTREGFVRRTIVRAEVEYLAPIRCKLDALEIFAEREIVVLERPGPAELTIEASGDVYYRASTTGEERRAGEMRLSGE